MKRLLTLTIAIGALATWSVRAADAKATFDQQCAKCHGKEGKGDTVIGKKLGCKDYTNAKVQKELKDDAAFNAIKEGYTTPEGKKVMRPAHGLSDDEIKALVAYMRSFKK